MEGMGLTVLAFWQKLPLVLRAVVAGTVVSFTGVEVWSALSLANQRYLIAVPWAVVPTGIFLWLFIRYLNGEGWPRTTSESRRVSLRANPISADIFGAAVLAGMLGSMAVLPFAGVLSRLVRLPVEAQPIRVPEGMPFGTVMLLLLAASAVAGVVEEAAFRGYMQGPIERRHGPFAAIVGTGVLFGLAHYTHHPAGVMAMLPYYIAVAAVYGSLAWLTNSIWPGVVVHAIGDVFSFGNLWLSGKPEWEMTASKPTALIWNGGADAAFWGNLAALIILASAATVAFVALANSTRASRAASR
jgi:membrane protease YdiL (CAAX protease family)